MPKNTANSTNAAAAAPGRPTPLLADALTFPVLAELDTATRLFDSLRAAARRRKGVIVTCPQGGGKTVGLAEAIEMFNEAEQVEAERTERPRRGIATINTLRESSLTQIVTAIYSEVFGLELAVTSRGKRKSYEDLRAELIQHLMNEHIAVLVIDEAETLPPEALLVLRDIMSVAEATAKDRFRREGTRRRYRPTGVGVLLVGTPELRNVIRDHREAGQRWVRMDTIDLIEAAEVPAIYRRMYPACDAYAKSVGDAVWTRFISRAVTPMKQALPIRFIENHLTDFHTRLVNCQPAATRIDALAFDAELFLYSLNVSRLQDEPERISAEAMTTLPVSA
jgi:type II secretory pathway predicted ATPase ExeA